MSQIFSRPVAELVRARRSVRTYAGQPLDGGQRRQLTEYLANARGVNGRSVRFALLDGDVAAGGAKLGTYGLIRGAKNFIVAMVPKGDAAALIELGFRLEQAVLFATDLGLGTVWLGGTFSKGQFAKAAALQEDETLAIVMPVGIPARSGSLIERIMRGFTSADHRMGWSELFFDGETQKTLPEAAAGGFRDALEALRLAPSAVNVQPWRVIRHEGRFDFYKVNRQAQAGFDMHLIDMGIAFCHFDLAARESGLAGAWRFDGDPKRTLPESYEYVATFEATAQ